MATSAPDGLARPPFAASLYGHALAIFRELGDRTCASYTLGDLVLVALDQGKLEAAAAFSVAWEHGVSLTVDQAVELALG